jgi:tRNA pseudouridine38-40 synthase
MQRIKLTIEYEGTPFVGWQRQREGLSIQGCLEQAIFKFTRKEINVFAAGRTDAGVHALCQVAHFDLPKYYPEHEIIGALNYHLRPHPIVVTTAEIVDKDFHARFSAKQREYFYKILNRSSPSALMQNRVWHVKGKLAAEDMHEAAQILVGRHDFSSFRATHCQAASPVKNMTSITVSRSDDDIINIKLAAPSFLHNQVRIIVGSLKKIGEGAWGIDKLKEVLAARKRSAAAETAPADGLYFYKVSY